MDKKREYGQYYTVKNPFNHILFREWMNNMGVDEVFLEPFAGSNNIPKLISDCGFNLKWKCFDIEPPEINSFPIYCVEKRDTILDFPIGYKVCITNCPYLGKSSARRRKIKYIWEEDDLYKVSLNRMLSNCDYVAAIIPESFITSGLYKDRLWGIISLTYKMFLDTECPVCLAMFTPYENKHIKIYSNDLYLGELDELSNIDIFEDWDNNWKFNDPQGIIGVKTIDGSKDADCKFFEGEQISSDLIKVSSRSFTRISGLPNDVNLNEFINECNIILNNYRIKTKDVLMTSFKGLRKDGKYRRRLDFKTVRRIMNTALVKIQRELSLF